MDLLDHQEKITSSRLIRFLSGKLSRREMLEHQGTGENQENPENRERKENEELLDNLEKEASFHTFSKYELNLKRFKLTNDFYFSLSDVIIKKRAESVKRLHKS